MIKHGVGLQVIIIIICRKYMEPEIHVKAATAHSRTKMALSACASLDGLLNVLNDYFKGQSFAAIADTEERRRLSESVKHMQMDRNILPCCMHTLTIKTGERFGVDEMYVNIRGKLLCLFMINDVETRFCLAHEMAYHKDYHNASGLLRAAKKKAGKIPCEFVTDALSSHKQAFAEVFAAKNHLDKHSIHLSNSSGQ